jgi:HAD superfamily phosphatase (TIGR01668 family)
MRHFQSGKFNKSGVSGPFRKLCPIESFHTLSEVDLELLSKAGKKLVLLDVDNTLLPWRSEDFPTETLEWLAKGKALGLKFCILSNTRNPERLKRLSDRMEVPFMTGRFKPNPSMYRLALQTYAVKPEEAIMIGDQLFTDVWGANRAGIEAIWVKPMGQHEFVGTRLNRFAERFVASRLYKTLLAEDDDLPIVPKVGLFQRRIVRQFAKFCIVGGSSFVIDAGLHRLLMFNSFVGHEPLSQVVGRWVLGLWTPAGQISAESAHDTAFAVFKIISASLAILNSFIWNRMWTFNIRGKDEYGSQLTKFVVVSLIGLGLNTVISSGINRMVAGSESRSWMVATFVAAAIVALWNFCGQRFWAFRKGSP